MNPPPGDLESAQHTIFVNAETLKEVARDVEWLRDTVSGLGLTEVEAMEFYSATTYHLWQAILNFHLLARALEPAQPPQK